MNSSKSAQYSKEANDQNNLNNWKTETYSMFLSRVCLGAIHSTPYKQLPGTVKPPDGHNSINGIADATGHNEFIVYDGNQAYPEYLIEFAKVK